MKSTITILSLCLCFFWSCQSETNSNTTDAETTKEAVVETPVHIKSEKSAVMVGFWHYAIALGNPEEAKKYEGRWIELKRDDTFISGIYLEETNSGTWSYEDDTNIIKLNFKEDEGIATEWETQGFGDVVIWKGNTPVNKTGTQVKMVKQLDGGRPGK